MTESKEKVLTKEIIFKAERSLLNDGECFMQPCKGERDGEPSLKRKFFEPPHRSLPPCVKKFIKEERERKRARLNQIPNFEKF